jgi:hypothetical protein
MSSGVYITLDGVDQARRALEVVPAWIRGDVETLLLLADEGSGPLDHPAIVDDVAATWVRLRSNLDLLQRAHDMLDLGDRYPDAYCRLEQLLRGFRGGRGRPSLVEMLRVFLREPLGRIAAELPEEREPVEAFATNKAELLRYFGRDRSNRKYLDRLVADGRLEYGDLEARDGHLRIWVKFSDPEEHRRAKAAIEARRKG